MPVCPIIDCSNFDHLVKIETLKASITKVIKFHFLNNLQGKLKYYVNVLFLNKPSPSCFYYSFNFFTNIKWYRMVSN